MINSIIYDNIQNDIVVSKTVVFLGDLNDDLTLFYKQAYLALYQFLSVSLHYAALALSSSPLQH